MSIKVLALNDDNHSKCYVTKWDFFSDCATFAKELLLAPHTETYEVREVYICDPQGELANWDEEKFCDMFSLLDGCSPDELAERDPEKYRLRQEMFEIFWENGEEWRYA